MHIQFMVVCFMWFIVLYFDDYLWIHLIRTDILFDV